MTVEQITFRVVNLRVEKADIRVCRPSRWGNPWAVRRNSGHGWRVEPAKSPDYSLDDESHVFQDRHMAHVWAVEAYRGWLKGREDLVSQLLLELNDRGASQGWTYRDHPEEVTLGCWCAPLPCHGDVLADMLALKLKRWNTRA